MSHLPVSRRAVTRALPAAPAALTIAPAATAHAALPLNEHSEWDEGVAQYERAKAAARTPSGLLDDSPELAALIAAEDHLAVLPAPNIAALAFKLELSVFADLAAREDEMRALYADIRRLAGEA